MPHKDIPSRQDIEALASVRTPHCVSIYIPTGPLPADSERAKIEIKNQFRDAVNQLKAEQAPKATIERLDEKLHSMLSDSMFWTYQANSLAIFINEDTYQTFRLPNRFTATVDVADRFYIKPLMRAITFSQSAFVLALSQKSVRLVRVSADQPAEIITVPDLPTDIESFVNLDMPGRLSSNYKADDSNIRLQQFAAAINKAVYPVIRATKLPLILASVDPLLSAYRLANSYKYISAEGLLGNSDALSPEALAEKARPILDDLYSAEVKRVRENFKAKEAQLLGSTDLEMAARGAALHAIDTLLIDFDERIPGYMNDDGTITMSSADDASNYGVGDEILRRALLVNARVYAVRSDEMPDGAKVAATFRFQVS